MSKYFSLEEYKKNDNPNKKLKVKEFDFKKEA